MKSIRQHGQLELERYIGVSGQVANAYQHYPWSQEGGRLKWLRSGTSSDPVSLQKLFYDYDAAGNITEIQDYKMGVDALNPQVQSFTYDAMDRLLSAEANDGTAGDYSETYSYSATTGNLASKGGLSYTYGDSNHAHAVTGLSNGNTYSYDSNGNMTQRVIGSDMYTLTYDVENRLVGVGGAASAEFGYDGDGERVIVSEGVTTTIHIGNYFQWNANSEEMTRYYFAGTTRVAMRKGSAAPLWLLGDHLGSASVTAQNDGSVHSRQGYKAWGESGFETGSPATEFQFTGQFNQVSLGIYFYQSRFYDPALGRWLQPDSIVPDQYNGLDWDRYQFVRSNPIKLKDPSGHIPIDVLIDFVFLAYNVGAIIVEGPTQQNMAALAADAVCAIIPYGTGGGLAVRLGGEAAIQGAVKLPAGVRALQSVLKLSQMSDDSSGILESTDRGTQSNKKGGFADKEKLNDHYKRHGEPEFSYKSADEYENAALDFIDKANDSQSGTLSIQRTNGDKVFYNPTTNEFAVIKSDGTLKTYMKPDPDIHGFETNLDYFYAQDW